jgi:ATP-dependent Zn protease
MTSEERELLATAYHEGGHAVVAFDQGIPLYSASVLSP